jgi:ABC-type nickel/cobalt efflux system permease component RcnA
MSRRLRLAVIIVVSQMLLIALAISWLVHMSIIAVEGSAYFVEDNDFILFSEIAASILITLFGLWVLILQIQRLGERRSGDRRAPSPAGLAVTGSEERQGQRADYHAIDGERVK